VVSETTDSSGYFFLEMYIIIDDEGLHVMMLGKSEVQAGGSKMLCGNGCTGSVGDTLAQGPSAASAPAGMIAE